MIRFSEPVGPSGGLSGQGILHLLGTPPFSPLALVLREAGQNIWDARRERRFRQDPPLSMLVRIRTLNKDQSRALRAIILCGGSSDDEPGNLLHEKAMERGDIRVLEICDFGTLGLNGCVNAQECLSNFTRFFFNIGHTHADGNSGGTYGYGRSSLYLAGETRTIFVDTLTTDGNGHPVRRFMGSRIGNSYELSINGRNRRFEGRHFWGMPNAAGDGILPLTGNEAEDCAISLGLPGRGKDDTGTSILIPWPVSVVQGEEEMQVTGNHIRDILLENFWPKLVPRPECSPPMEMRIEDEGEAVEVPNPETHGVYRAFSMALKRARTRNENICQSITAGPAAKVTGHLAFEPVTLPEDTVDKSMYNRIALMRHSELVVKYMPVPEAAMQTDWAGVFLCSDDAEVREAFAKAEPPAHDDWIHEGLTERNHRMWVNVTKRHLPRKAIERFAPLPSAPPQPRGPSIAAGLDECSETLLSGDGDSAAPSGTTRSGGGGGVRRLGKPQFEYLRSDANGNIVTFMLPKNFSGTTKVRAYVEIVGAEGNDREKMQESSLPRVLGWRLPTDDYVDGDLCTLSDTGEYRFEVQFRGLYAIMPKYEIIQGE